MDDSRNEIIHETSKELENSFEAGESSFGGESNSPSNTPSKNEDLKKGESNILENDQAKILLTKKSILNTDKQFVRRNLQRKQTHENLSGMKVKDKKFNILKPF